MRKTKSLAIVTVGEQEKGRMLAKNHFKNMGNVI